MGMSKDEIIKGIIHHKLKEKSKQELNHDECFDCPYRPNGMDMCESIETLLDDALVLLKEQEADIIAMSRFLESHGWDSDSICGKNVEIVVTNGDDDDA